MGRTWRGSRRNNRGNPRRGGQAGSNLGLLLESRVENVLKKMLEMNNIDSFKRYPPNTPRKDFQIVLGEVIKEVNITASQKTWKEHYARFGNEVEVICFHPNVSDDQIYQRILSIFTP